MTDRIGIIHKHPPFDSRADLMANIADANELLGSRSAGHITGTDLLADSWQTHGGHAFPGQ